MPPIIPFLLFDTDATLKERMWYKSIAQKRETVGGWVSLKERLETKRDWGI